MAKKQEKTGNILEKCRKKWLKNEQKLKLEKQKKWGGSGKNLIKNEKGNVKKSKGQ